jgi:hypothetical protein
MTVANVYTLLVNAAKVFAGTGKGVYVSTDNGTSWTAMNFGLTNTSVYALAGSDSGVFAGTYGGGIFLSTNNGTSWSDVSSGMTNKYVRSLEVSGGSLFAGVDYGGVWRRPLSEMITSAPQSTNQMPDRYELLQNYPNPFNPSTTIRFDLPMKSRVRLMVFNILGQKIAELANGEMVAGSHERIWNANIASGLYFYRLEAVSATDPNKRFVDVKKMILLK